MDHIKSLS